MYCSLEKLRHIPDAQVPDLLMTKVISSLPMVTDESLTVLDGIALLMKTRTPGMCQTPMVLGNVTTTGVESSVAKPQTCESAFDGLSRLLRTPKEKIPLKICDKVYSGLKRLFATPKKVRNFRNFPTLSAQQ